MPRLVAGDTPQDLFSTRGVSPRHEPWEGPECVPCHERPLMRRWRPWWIGPLARPPKPALATGCARNCSQRRQRSGRNGDFGGSLTPSGSRPRRPGARRTDRRDGGRYQVGLIERISRTPDPLSGRILAQASKLPDRPLLVEMGGELRSATAIYGFRGGDLGTLPVRAPLPSRGWSRPAPELSAPQSGLRGEPSPAD